MEQKPYHFVDDKSVNNR